MNDCPCDTCEKASDTGNKKFDCDDHDICEAFAVWLGEPVEKKVK